jgi:hypothetical protein
MALQMGLTYSTAKNGILEHIRNSVKLTYCLQQKKIYASSFGQLLLHDSVIQLNEIPFFNKTAHTYIPNGYISKCFWPNYKHLQTNLKFFGFAEGCCYIYIKVLLLCKHACI